MKILKYILMVIGGFIGGVLFPLMESTVSYLDENMNASSYIYIPDKTVFAGQITIGLIIGVISGWVVWLCIYWAKQIPTRISKKINNFNNKDI
jgi:hypothetical protein